MTPMTMRERILAVVQGRPHDRVPFVMYDGIPPPEEVQAQSACCAGARGAGRNGLFTKK